MILLGTAAIILLIVWLVIRSGDPHAAEMARFSVCPHCGRDIHNCEPGAMYDYGRWYHRECHRHIRGVP